jgi:glycosyltransferase involved in cell wall biosynthesis
MSDSDIVSVPIRTPRRRPQASPPAAIGNGRAPMRPTKVLLISLFHPELVRGGAQQVCYELFEGLKEAPGIEPVLLASVDQSYPALYKSGARITGFDGRPNEFVYLSAEYDYTWHKTSSDLHVAVVEEFLATIRPDVVHFHHFLTMGIDWLTLVRRVLPECRIIFTFHEFLSICHADGHMVRRTDRSLCTQASPIRCHQCFPELLPEHFLLRRMWFMRHLAAADLYTCPSRFMIEHYVNWGLARGRIRHVTNGQRNHGDGVQPVLAGPRRRFGFFGQFVDVKGVVIILRAVQILRAAGVSGFTVDLNGDNLRYASAAGREEVESFLADEALLAADERIVRNNGSYEVSQLHGRMARVDWCIVPSVWWEIFGLVISEAWMFGKPVICSNVGGMRERVKDEVSGLHFEVGDPDALARVMLRAMTEEGLWERLHANLPAPPSRETMVNGYLEVYAEAAGARLGEAVAGEAVVSGVAALL